MRPAPPLGPEAVNRTGKHIVGVSGGKDSTALALALKATYPSVPFEFVITPTGDELPEMWAHWLRIEEILGQPLKKLDCPTLQETIDRNRALPNFRMRFCTREIKIRPFMEYMEKTPKDSVLYVGLRKDEEDRTGLQVPEDDTYRIAFPFQWWGWKEEEVLGYLKLQNIEIPKRTDCARCFYQRIDEWKDLYKEHPDIYYHAALQEALTGFTFRSDKRDSWPADLISLAKEFDKGREPKKRKKNSKVTACPWCAK